MKERKRKAEQRATREENRKKKKDRKKRRKGGKTTRERADNDTVESRKTQRQGRELNQHNTPSSTSPSSSPQRASAEGKKKNKDQNQRGHVFVVPRSSDSPAVRRSFSTVVFVRLNYQRGKEIKHIKWDRKEENKGNEDTKEEPTNGGS
jgi:hypothetical protein